MATTNLEFYKNNADNDFECNLDYDDYDFDDDYDETEEYRQIKRDRFRNGAKRNKWQRKQVRVLSHGRKLLLRRLPRQKRKLLPKLNL